MERRVPITWVAFALGSNCHQQAQVGRQLLRIQLRENHQLSSSDLRHTQCHRQAEVTESCKDMACPTELDQDMDRISSGEPVKLPRKLLGAFKKKQSVEESVKITNLHGVLVSAILTWVSTPVDVASAFVASRIFWSVAKTTPFRLKLRPRRSDEERNRATWTRSAVAGIRRTMSSTKELDVSGCLLLNADVAQLLVDLSSLERLILTECEGEEMTTSTGDALSTSVRSRLLSLSVQKCSEDATGNLFTSTTVVGSRLETLLLGQLGQLRMLNDILVSESLEVGTGKSSWESMKLVKNVVSEVEGSRLRILAINNCSNFGVAELAVIGETCTYLEILMLGGSTQASHPRFPQHASETFSAALLTTAQRLHRLRILDITFFGRPIFYTVRERISPSVHVWDFCEQNSVMAAGRLVARLKGCSMPFVSSEESARVSARDAWCRGWRMDFSYSWTDEVKPEKPGECCVDDSHFTRWDLATTDILLALQAGASCYNWELRTPLHMACARRDSDRVAKLVFIGASVEVRDQKGATALMEAARSGSGEVCDLLLKAGADVLAKNSTTQATPRYTARTDGRWWTGALEVMIAHCKEHDIDWQDSLYASDVLPSVWEEYTELLNRDR